MSRILMRQDTGANWASANPVLARGEYGLDLTSLNEKLGDGVTAWNALPYRDDAVGLPRVLARGGAWTVQTEADTATGVFTIRAVGPGGTKLLTWNPSTNAVTADGKLLATQEWAAAAIGGALVVGPVILP